MSSHVYSSARCFKIVEHMLESISSGQELSKNISKYDISQLTFACVTEFDKENNDLYSELMEWTGIYIAIASFVCILAMATDLFHGLKNKKLWFPSKYFSLNAASLTVIAVTMKLTVDLSSEMQSYIDQATKVESLAFMCVMMANLMPSLASMDNKTLLANIVAILASKEILESKYQATNKMALTDQRILMSKAEKLRQLVRRYWVMAETGNPQFVVASNPLCVVSGVICVILMVINMLFMYRILIYVRPHIINITQNDISGSSYKLSTTFILLTQFIGVIVGTIAPISRCFLVFNFKLITKGNLNYFMFLKVEKYWTQKLYEWKQCPILFLSSNQRSRSLIYDSKSIILSLCIAFQKVIVILCKVAWFIVIIGPIFVVYRLKSIKARWFTPPITSRTRDIEDDLNNYVLQIDNHMELAEETLKGISKSMNSFISMAEKEQNNNLLELLEKSSAFEGIHIFDIDHVKPLLPVELVNSWSLPIVTLTCIAVALPNIHKDEVESFLRHVGEGLSFTHLVEDSLNSANEYVNILRTTRSLWLEVEHRRKWLDNTLEKYCFEGKTVKEIVEWFSNKAKQIVIAIKESTTDKELAENPPHTLIAANSMYRITQTILLRYQSNIEKITKKQLFAHLNGMIADIFSACFTNLPRVITIRCHESVIEKREASVKVAAKLLGETTEIIERLETLKLPSMEVEKMAYIDEWRLYLKQANP